jgi:hypothetical protein
MATLIRLKLEAWARADLPSDRSRARSAPPERQPPQPIRGCRAGASPSRAKSSSNSSRRYCRSIECACKRGQRATPRDHSFRSRTRSSVTSENALQSQAAHIVEFPLYSRVPKFCGSNDGMPSHALVIGGHPKIFRYFAGQPTRAAAALRGPLLKSRRQAERPAPLGVSKHDYDQPNREQTKARQ